MPKKSKNLRSAKQKAADKKKSDNYKKVKMIVNISKATLIGGSFLAGKQAVKLMKKNNHCD